MAVKFFNDEISFKLKGKREIANWLKNIAKEENKTIDDLYYVFVSDNRLLEMNIKYLNHDCYTDIITFDYSSGNTISGEMYVSIETVKENAKEYNVDFRNELLRVMLHGALHLCGYKDETEDEKKKMRAIENKYLEAISY